MILPLVLRLYIISFVYTWISPYDTINSITHNKLLHCRLWQLNMLHNVWLPSYVIMSQCKLCQIPKPAFTYVKHWKFRTFIWKTLHVSLSQEESYNTCDQNNVYSHKKLCQCRRLGKMVWILLIIFNYSQNGSFNEV